jgi:hypothetical protein
MQVIANLPSADERLQKAWRQYVQGEIGPWDFQAVVEHCGFRGWTGQADGTVIIHCQ